MNPAATLPDFDGRAACRGADTELFFPHGVTREVAEPALAYCRRCPAVERCLEYALLNIVDGIWGGTTQQQREDIRRRHRIAARHPSDDIPPPPAPTKAAEYQRALRARDEQAGDLA